MELQIVDPKEYGIEESKALELTTGLNPVLENRSVLIEKFNEIKDFEVSTNNSSVFKALRIEFQKNRTQGINEWHKSAKEVSLRVGQLLDAVKRNETKTNENYESFLEEKEKFFENQEKERLLLLKTEREAFLRPFVEVIPNGLEDLDQDVFDSFLETKKKAHLEKLELERLEAERIENERLEREKEIEAQRVENERLKAEAEAKEKVRKERGVKMQPYIVYIRDYNKLLEMSDADFEKEIASVHKGAMEDMKYQAEKLQAEENERNAEARRKQQEFEKATEIRLKEEAEKKAKEEKEKAEALAKAEAEKLAKAPIKKQLSVWVESFEIPVVGIDNETSKEIIAKFELFKKWSLTQVNNL